MVNLIDVQNEYIKDPKLKVDDVKLLMDWANKQPHLPKITELQAILFLHSCYYSIEKAKSTLDIFFTVRTICPELFAKRNPNDPSVKNTLNVSVITPLQKLTPEGYMVTYFKLMDTDPEKYVFANQIKLFDMVSMLHLNRKGTSNGFVILADMDGIQFGHVAKINLMAMKKFFYYLQEAMPVRLKGMHFINVVPFMDKILALMKPFMKKELLDMLHLHTDSVESLYKFVPPECLPQEIGGKCDSRAILQEKSRQLINDNADFFKFEEQQTVDETKRPGKAKNAGDFFGIEGSFKKLEVD